MTMRNVFVASALLLAAGCSKAGEVPLSAPPRSVTAPPVAGQPSRIDVPVSIRIAMLRRALEQEVPRTLWSIDELQPNCIPAQRVLKLKVTPDLSCQLIGKATRGDISVGGTGDTLTLSMPVSIQVSARHIGKLLKGGTATAAARVRMSARLGLTSDWQPNAKVDIDYRWTQIPGIDVFGQRLRFGSKVEPKLRAHIPAIERRIAAEIAQLDVRRAAAGAWAQGFAVLELNRARPPVWLRVTPQQVHFGGYRVSGDAVALDLGVTALTETFVGQKPDPVPATVLPQLDFGRAPKRASLHVPVISDYAELEPVLARALHKLSAKGIAVEKIGRVAVRFGDVTIYGTDRNRLAVGIDLEAQSPRGLLAPKGRVWLTGLPVNEPGSRIVRVRDLAIHGRTDSAATNLLAAVVLSPETVRTIADSLGQNFERDFQKVLTKANAAIRNRRDGDFGIEAMLTDVENGRITAYGLGLYMPVTATGRATIRYTPALKSNGKARQ